MILSAIRICYRMFNRAFPSVRNQQRGEVDSAPYRKRLRKALTMQENWFTLRLVLEAPVWSPCGA